ncbi:MAG: TIGR03936 family radical SAM-associated protein [Candidatus Gastranaerophilales bacterium]|nr:TIGR03936 family radical SAM-associated protein [Candidatus Gastranaerophilales bacterium]
MAAAYALRGREDEKGIKGMVLRVKFKKYGRVRYIGHLDVMRFFQKANRRAGLDVAYSIGFSPHQIMSFAAPLGVGLESNGEYMDLEVHSIVSCEQVKERLNRVSVPGIEVISVRILPEDAENAMASVAAASYTVRFKEGRELDFVAEQSMESALADFMGKDTIPFVKQTKKSVREVDLKPGIYELTWDGSAFHMLLDASSGGNIKPVQVLTALFGEHKEQLKENALSVTREDTFTEVIEHGERHFVPLEEIGMTDSEYAEREGCGVTDAKHAAHIREEGGNRYEP